MTEKELKKLNRYQLLKLLLLQAQRGDELELKVAALESKLKDREIKLSTLGSIAEASLELEGVFAAAQKAADLYVSKANEKADEILAQAQEKADKILAEALGKAEKTDQAQEENEELKD